MWVSAMKAAAFIGRIGPLAVMLGIGTSIALGGVGVAAADSTGADATSSQSGPSVASSSARDTAAESHATDSGDGLGSTAESGSDVSTSPDQDSESGADTASNSHTNLSDNSAEAQTQSEDFDEPLSEGASADDTLDLLTSPTSTLPPETQSQDGQEDPPPETAAADENLAPQPAAAASARTSSPPEPAAVGPSTATSTSQRDTAAPRGGFFQGLTTFFNNQQPTLTPTQTGESTGGVVTGQLNISDPDSTALTHRLTANPNRGNVVLHPNGSYTYTPARAWANSGTTDSFQVTVSDAASGFHIHGFSGLINLFTFGLFGSSGHTRSRTVAVTVNPFVATNSAPTGNAVVGVPDPITGVVLGSIIGADPDGDALTYSGSTTTTKGAVIVTPTGSFSYTPTLTARQNAYAPGATPADRADGFTVTIADGFGGTGTVPVTVAIARVPDPEPPSSLAAFPGAEGFGSAATGGRGGQVVYVTNTNASGPGSLQWAIDQPGAKYILFKVSGVIDAQIHLTNGDVTIAGQTSPGGITIRGFVTDETPYQDQIVRTPTDFAQNWILQHVRIRPGLNGPSDDGLRLRYTRNAIVDHVSIGNATDEAVEISYSNNITIQNSILAETLGGHSFYGGVLMNYSNPASGFGLDNVSLHHNIFNRIEGRLPEGSRESAAAAGSTMNLELSNNLYWDPRFFIALGSNTGVVTDGRGNPYPIYWNINAVNNYFRTGSGFPYGMFDDQILGVARNRLFVSGNKMSLYPTRSDYELFYCCNDYSSVTDPDDTSRAAQQLSARHPFPVITYTPTDMLRTVLLNTAGAWSRDPMDTRLLQSVAQNTISASPPNVNPAGDALLLPYRGSPPAAPTDTDSDGMPDAWEIAKGLNPNVANHNATTLSAQGFTNLDIYLHELSASRISGGTLV